MNKAEKPQLHKTDVMCRIFKVGVWLDPKGFNKRINEIEVNETDKYFVGDGKRISKYKLMKIDTVFFENHNSIRYFAYCLDGQQQEALKKIKEHIVLKVKLYKEEIDVLVSYL